ncbi:MAG TPA: alpha/beta hydrolase, partial [Candidatus Binatia bacterium]|nr:alpha/beta hydrolase [Candidatus Binatia bacterium]
MTELGRRTVRVGEKGIEAGVAIAGQGPPLVFFHAAAGLTWDGFLDSLAKSYTVHAIEHPGTTEGNPDAIREVDDLWDLVLFYDDVLETLGLRQAPVVGHSFGGMVAAELAATRPERVSRLVLLCPVGLWRDDAPVTNWMTVTPAADLAKVLFAHPESNAARELLALPDDPEERVRAQARFLWALGCTGKFVWPIPDRGLHKRLHRIAAPTLVVWGREDRLAPVVYAAEFGRRIRGARIEVVDAAGHELQLERPD